MTLTTRLSLFFLGALGVVLVGFSLALYLLARTYLHHQAEDRLEASLNTLAAAAEVGPDGIEWEPHERPLSVGQESGSGPIFWIVSDDRGQRLDSSPAEAERMLADFAWASSDQDRLTRDQNGEPWLFSRRRLYPNTPKRQPSAGEPAVHPGEEGKYPVLLITVGVSLGPVQDTLRSLALALVGISVVLWLLAAFVGRLLCRRALVPVTQMATTARSLSAATLDQRLPLGGTGDELDDLGRAFNDLLTRLQDSFERQRRFTGDASHQLRTPLTAMLGQVEVALRRERSLVEYREVLTRVQGQAVQLRQIVELLLFLARADAEARLPDPTTIDLAEWLQEHLQSWSGHPRTADLRIESRADKDFPVEAHPTLLGQVVDNLLDNACKYSQ